MIVLPQAKALALKLRDPQKVLELLPTAKKVNYNGVSIVAVPHRLDEMKVLRNIGINAPSPILSYYDWKGGLAPYRHQRLTSAFLTMHRKALVLNDIGTGKTMATLWAADYLMSIGRVKKCLVITPVSTLEEVWGNAIFTCFTNRKALTLYGTAAKRKKLLGQDADFYIINHEGFRIVAEQSLDMFDLVIIDEAAKLRNPGTSHSKLMRKWVDKQPDLRLWLVTGAPTPNGPPDAWALSKLVGNPKCPRGYQAFRDAVMHKINMYTWVPRKHSEAIVHSVLQPSIRFARKDCLDLPETTYQTRRAELTKVQRKHYSEMLKHFITEVSDSGGTISAVNQVSKMQKLVQIACGVAYAEDGAHVELDCAPRIALTKSIIEEAGGKVIVFTPLVGTLKMLETKLAEHWSVAVVNGAVSLPQRNKIFQSFQQAEDPRVIVAHPATMSHGLTLTAANCIIWYGPITSNDQYTQANGRIERISKRYVSSVVHIESTELERRMFERLKRKQDLQGLLLDLIQQHTEEMK